MKKQYTVKALLATLAAGSGILLSGCNSGSATAGGGQSTTAAPMVASQAAKSLFASNSCLTATAAFPASSSLWWYSGATIVVKNTCSTNQDLSSTTFSLTSQDSAGNAVSIGTFNNWWYNSDSYAITFTGGATQTGSITTGNKTTPTILANDSITFTGGGWNLNNTTYNSTLATSSFAMNGGGVTPPVDQYGTLNVVVNTVNTDCKGTTTCSGKVIATVTNSSNVQVGNPIVVPDASLGGTFTQPITNLAPGTYKISGSGITDTTISYDPTNAQGVVTANGTTSVTVKYDKTAPVATYGTATISLAKVVPNYKGNVQVKVLDTKNSNTVVGSFSLAQGSSVTTDSLPVSDSTHAYSVQLTTGIADPVTGAYYIESNNTALTIAKGSNTFAIPMVKSAIANKNVTVVISGLESGDTAATSFSDAAGKYVYANPASKSNESTTYKIESGLNLGVSVAANGSNTYKVNPINNTAVINAAKTIKAAFQKESTPVVTTQKYVTPYLLIDNWTRMNKFMSDLASVSKPNFNRVVISFLKPSLQNYQDGSLANTGILGYFTTGDGDGVNSFNKLKANIATIKAKNIEVLISVGGWNYSCDPAYYSNCGPVGDNYDTFPDASTADGKKAYANLVKLVNSLGAQGIDLDYEEFWHADKYAQTWSSNPWDSSVAAKLKLVANNSYDGILSAGVTSTNPSSGGTNVMPKTVEKLAGIVQAIHDNITTINSSLVITAALPPVGATPIMDFVYGDNGKDDVYTYGGVWWLGNLKGLFYNLAWKYPTVANYFQAAGIMTYDLASNDPAYTGAGGDLSSQVNTYMGLYKNFLESSESSNLTVNSVGKIVYKPAHFKLPTKFQFGFEVNKPAYGDLTLTPALVTTILNNQKDSDGDIIWEMYSVQPTGGTTTKNVLQQSCATFLANDSRYDCSANIPSTL